MVAVDKDRKPAPVPGVLVETPEEKARYAAAEKRRKSRKSLVLNLVPPWTYWRLGPFSLFSALKTRRRSRSNVILEYGFLGVSTKKS